MIQRRDVLLGALCVAGAAGAFALIPRKRVSLMSGLSLKDIVPTGFGPWSSRDVTDLVDAPVENSLESRLYNETMQRVFTNRETGRELMVLLAHGGSQTNDLQLHRPEVCYPAFGFEVVSTQRAGLKLAQGAVLPVRQLVVVAPDRRENIVYWTRLGEYLPASENEQRADRFQTVLHGYVADGLLARFSLLSEDSPAAISGLREFILAFVKATSENHRSALVGSRLAGLMDNKQG
jgi:EpsI family protein